MRNMAGREFIEKVCPVCGVLYALSEEFDRRRRELPKSAGSSARGWHCPNGHSLVYTESQLDRMTQRRNELLDRLHGANAEIERVRRSRAAYKGQVTRLSRKAREGHCPVDGCGDHFADLSAHMSEEHPDWSGPELVIVDGEGDSDAGAAGEEAA